MKYYLLFITMADLCLKVHENSYPITRITNTQSFTGHQHPLNLPLLLIKFGRQNFLNNSSLQNILKRVRNYANFN